MKYLVGLFLFASANLCACGGDYGDFVVHYIDPEDNRDQFVFIGGCIYILELGVIEDDDKCIRN